MRSGFYRDRCPIVMSTVGSAYTEFIYKVQMVSKRHMVLIRG